MALAASVGDSLLDSAMGDDLGGVIPNPLRGIEPLTGHKQGTRGDAGNHNTDTSILSWPEQSLQPHQVSYDAMLVAELGLSFVDNPP